MANDHCPTCGAATNSTSESKPYTTYCPSCGVLGIVSDSLDDPYGDYNLKTTGSEWFRSVLEKRLPGADIRTDQSTTVRIYWRNVIAGIRPLDGGGYDVAAGDALTQTENITFELAAEAYCESRWDAIHRVVEFCLMVVSRR